MILRQSIRSGNKISIVKTSWLSLLLLVFVIILPIPTRAADVPDNFSGGDGSAMSPYLISNADDLAALSLRVVSEDKNNSHYGSACYLQTEDIDMEGIDAWTPIGNRKDNAFKGVYDGGGKKISDVTYGSNDVYYIGLFGIIKGDGKTTGIVKNLNLAIRPNTKIQYSDKVVHESIFGSLTGFLDGGKIENCNVTSQSTLSFIVIGTVQKLKIGGIVGKIGKGSIEKCTNFVNLKIYINEKMNCSNVNGGVVGEIENGRILNCRNKGDIEVSAEKIEHLRTGGIVGAALNSQIEGLFNTGSIQLNSQAYASVGGVVAVMTRGSLNCSANAAPIKVLVKAHEANAGGIVGVMLGNSIENSWNSGDIRTELDYVTHSELINKTGKNGNFFARLASGGIAGSFNGGIILNAGNAGNIRGKLSIEGASAIIFLGGIAGIDVPFLKKTTAIQNSFNTGLCEIESWNGGETLHGTGGIVGMSVEGVSGRNKIENSYWMENKGSTEGIARSNGKDESIMFSADDFQNPENFKGWDFEKIWMMPPENPGHPVLRYLPLE
jgi:hypothetical protein